MEFTKRVLMGLILDVLGPDVDRMVDHFKDVHFRYEFDAASGEMKITATGPGPDGTMRSACSAGPAHFFADETAPPALPEPTSSAVVPSML